MKAQLTAKPDAERKPSLPAEPCPLPGDLTFRVRNLGSVRQGSFTQKPLTLFCGPNNTGKTWTMHSLCYWHQGLRGLKRKDIEKNKDFPKLTKYNQIVSETLAELFNTPEETLRDARFELAARWPQTTPAPENLHKVFLMPAERNDLHLFFRELRTRRTALLHHASKEKIDINELLRDVIRSRYSAHIADYINWLNMLPENQKSKSKNFHRFAKELKKELAEGAYKVDRDGNIEFKPYQRKRDGNIITTIGLHLTSSTVKSLFGLWFYLEHQARKGDILMIDEPELNIHPENQRKIARLFARLVNNGLNVVISTHSDYIVREINSLIMLSQDAAKHLRKKYKYKDEEILKPKQVGAYHFTDQTIKPFNITDDDGIHATTFDEVIEKLNNVNDDIFCTL